MKTDSLSLKLSETINTNASLSVSKVSKFDTASPINCVLPDATEGMLKVLVAVNASASVTVVPTNAAGFTSLLLNLTGQTAVLQFLSGKWYIISVHGTTVT